MDQLNIYMDQMNIYINYLYRKIIIFSEFVSQRE